MAIISSYQPDGNLTTEDLLVGSNYVGTVNGVKQYNTRSYSLAALSAFFALNTEINGELYDISKISARVDNLQDMFTYAEGDTELTGEIGGMSTTLIGYLNTWVATKNYRTDAVPTDTDGLDEGATNFYYTQDRFNASLATKTTDNLDEGLNNFYYTTERVHDDVNDLLTEGAGITLTYDDNGNTLQIASSITQYTDADARGAISHTDNGGYGSLSYDSSTGVISYTGPSSSDIRGEFTAGANITITDGEIAADLGSVTSDKHDSLAFTTATFGSPANEETFDGVTYKYFDFEHNLAKYPAVTVTETSNADRICFVPVKYIDNNTVRVYFRGTTSGTVYVN